MNLYIIIIFINNEQNKYRTMLNNNIQAIGYIVEAYNNNSKMDDQTDHYIAFVEKLGLQEKNEKSRQFYNGLKSYANKNNKIDKQNLNKYLSIEQSKGSELWEWIKDLFQKIDNAFKNLDNKVASTKEMRKKISEINSEEEIVFKKPQIEIQGGNIEEFTKESKDFWENRIKNGKKYGIKDPSHIEKAATKIQSAVRKYLESKKSSKNQGVNM